MAIDNTIEVCIYGLYDPKDRQLRYIGKTKHLLSTRLSQHISEAVKHGKTHRHKWINKLLNEGVRPSIKLLEKITESEWEEAEKKWIASCRKQGLNLVNETDGGESPVGRKLSKEHIEKIRKANMGNDHSLGYKHSNETKRKMSEAHKNRKYSRRGSLSNEHKRKISIANTGRSTSDETREKISIALTGRVISDETKQKLREANLGKKYSKEVRQRMSESHKNISEETREKLSTALTGNQNAKGLIHSEETKKMIGKASRKSWGMRKNEN